MNHVGAFVRIARAAPSLRVKSICAAIGVSPRTLHAQFRRELGTAPSFFMLGLRLDRARHALMSDRRASVTEIATRYGFLELGRFSVAYRKRFGECPSATRQRANERGGPFSPPLAASRAGAS